MSRAGRRAGTATAPPADEAVIWHDVECAGYRADLPVWRALAAAASGAVLELGAGTGRVTLDLAARGHDLSALDSDPTLVAALGARARERGLDARAIRSDARAFELGRRFGLAIAPMQVAQLLDGPDGRRSMLASVRRHLEPGALLAVALADPLDGLQAETALPPLPDVVDHEGWIFSSTPVALRPQAGGVAIDRLRQAVSPAGDLSESMATVVLDRVEPEEIEALAPELSYRPCERRAVPDTEGYVGSTVVVLEAV